MSYNGQNSDPSDKLSFELLNAQKKSH